MGVHHRNKVTQGGSTRHKPQLQCQSKHMEKLARRGARANAPNTGNLKQHRRDPSLERKQIEEFSLEINHFLQSEILLVTKKRPHLWRKSMVSASESNSNAQTETVLK